MRTQISWVLSLSMLVVTGMATTDITAQEKAASRPDDATDQGALVSTDHNTRRAGREGTSGVRGQGAEGCAECGGDPDR